MWSSRTVARTRTVLRDVWGKQQVSKVTNSSGYKERGPVVQLGFKPLDPDLVKVPIFTDETRQEIFKSYKDDPARWTIPALSQKYHCTLERTTAIIYLMQRREDLMRKNQVLNIPELWDNMMNKHVAEPPATPEALAAENEMTVEEVNVILERMKDHRRRLRNLKFDEDHKAAQLEDFTELGIDVRFREPKMAVKDGSIRSSYYPTLFGDDGFESTKYDLLKRVERETRVMPIKDIDHYLTREAQAIKKTEELASRPVDPSYKPPYLRSKIAFKDMCSHKKDPILIRTRDGRYRCANPLEEVGRSWTRHPNGIDMLFNAHKIEKFKDPDGDDAKAYAMIGAKREKLKRIKLELAAAKAKA